MVSLYPTDSTLLNPSPSSSCHSPSNPKYCAVLEPQRGRLGKWTTFLKIHFQKNILKASKLIPSKQFTNRGLFYLCLMCEQSNPRPWACWESTQPWSHILSSAETLTRMSPKPFQASWDILDWDFCISMCASPSFDCFISTSSTLWIKLFYFKYRENCSYIDFYHTTCRMFYTFPFLFRLISFPNRPFHLGQVKWVFLIPLFLWSTSLMRPSIVPTSNTKHCISVYNVATSCGWLQIVIRQVYFILVALGFC